MPLISAPPISDTLISGTTEYSAPTASFLGPDVLHWRDGTVLFKPTYAKVRAAKLE